MNEPISLPEILDADVKRIRTLITGLRDYASCINEPAYASAWIRQHLRRQTWTTIFRFDFRRGGHE